MFRSIQKIHVAIFTDVNRAGFTAETILSSWVGGDLKKEIRQSRMRIIKLPVKAGFLFWSPAEILKAKLMLPLSTGFDSMAFNGMC